MPWNSPVFRRPQPADSDQLETFDGFPASAAFNAVSSLGTASDSKETAGYLGAFLRG